MSSINHFVKSNSLVTRFKIYALRLALFLLVAALGTLFTLGTVSAVRAAAGNIPLFAPSISAQKADAFVGGDGDGKADPGETIRYTTTISNGGSSDATGVTFNDTIDNNTTLVGPSVSTSPVALDDTLPVTVTGNVSINTALMATPFSVITNDYQGQNMSPGLTISAYDTLSAQGGNVSMTTSGAGMGRFTYDPPAGYEGTDTFTYTLSDNSNAASAVANRKATVTITVSGMIWFVNNNAALGCTSDGCGRLSNPYSTLAAFNAANDGTDILFSHHPAANDNIFVYESGTNYLLGVTLLSGQKLIGQDSTQTLSAVSGLTPVTGSAALPAMNLGAPATVIQNTGGNGVTLNSGNTLNGFTASNSSGSSILGSGFGTLTVADVIVNTNGQALSLTNGTLSATFPSVTSTGGTNNIVLAKGAGSLTGTLTISGGALSGATGNAFDLNGGTATISDAGTIASGSAHSVNVTGLTGGTVTFSGAITDTDTGISLTTNTGATIAFTGGLALSTSTNTAFNVTGGGTVTAVQNNTSIVNTLTTTTGTALNFANTTIGASGLTFRSVSSNGAANGIVLNNTGGSGTLTVTGNGGTCNSAGSCTGGALQNSTSAAISLTNTTSPSFTRIAIQNAAQSGIDGQQVTNFTLANSFIDNVGTGAAGQYVESNIAFNDGGAFNSTAISGTISITNSILTNARRHGIDIENGSGTISNLTISNNTISSSTNAAVSLGHGILVLQQGSAATTAHLTTATISTNTITNFPSGSGVFVAGGSGNASNSTSATLGASGTPVSITGNFIHGTAGSRMGSNAIIVSFNGQVGVSNFDISNNGNVGNPLGYFQGLGISVFMGGTVTGTTTVDNNYIVSNQSIGAGSAGIATQVDDGPAALNNATADVNFVITNNNVSANEGNGIRAIARASNGKMDVTIQNNNVSAPTLTNRNGIRIDSGSAAGDVTTCLSISGNTSAGSGVNQGIGIRKQGTVAATNDFGIVGLSPSPTTGANAAARVTTNNPAGGGTDALSGDNFTSCTVTAMAPNSSHVVAKTQPESNPQVREAAANVATVNTVSLAGKVSKQAVWAKASNVALLSGNINTSNAQPVSFRLPAPAQFGEAVGPIVIGVLPAGKSVKVVYDVTVNNPLPQNATKILNPSVITGSNFSTVNSTDTGPGPDCTGPGTQTCTPIDLIDLTASKTNDTSSTVVLGTDFTWQIQISNVATSRDAVFNSGDIVLEDHLPSGPTYDAPSVAPTVGVIGLPNCSITSDVLTCTAPVGGVTIPSSEGIAVAFIVHTNTAAPGPLVNPTGGVCTVDPNAIFAEVSTANNTCSDTVTVTRPNTSVSSITLQSANPNKNATVTWQIVFANAVNGLTSSNFSLVQGGSVTGASISGVTETSGPPSTTWNITANTGSGDGTLGLNFVNDTGMTYAITNAPFTGQVYTIDKTAPLVSSIVRQSPASNPTSADVLVFRVTFNEAVTGVGAGSFVRTGTTTPISSSVSAVTPNLVYDFTIDGIADGGDLSTLNGTVGLNIAASPTITDLAGNTLQVVEPTPAASNDQTYTLDNTAPTVTINQAGGQSDPTNASPINFTVVFSEPVTGFATGDVDLSAGTAPGTLTGTVTGGPTTYNVAVSGMTGDGTVIASIAVNKAQDLAGNNNAASTSTDGTVTYDATAPTVTINQAGSQSDPTGSSPINFTVVFSEPVTGFATGDVDLSASTTPGTLTGTVTGGPTTYNVAVSGMTGDGTVIASIAVNKAQDLAGNDNAASTSTDNSVLYDTVPPSVTINQAIGQSDPTSTSPINFTVTFSEAVTGFATGDVDLSTGTAPGTLTGTVTGGPTVYNVAVSGMTGNGTVIATIPAGVAFDLASQPNDPSTSTDHTVSYVPPVDLSITKTDGVTTATPGGSVTYTITASNAGPNDDPAATVADTFPASLTVNWTCVGAGGGTCTASGSGNINDTVNLPVGGFVTYTATATINPSATGSLSNTATVTASASLADTTPGNNSATDTDTLSPQADLSITKTDGVTTATPGGSVTYTITASNAGPSNAPGATVADTFPASLTVNWTCVGAGGGTCTASGSGNINDTVNLPAGGSVTYTASAAISASATGTLSNTATVAAPGGVTDPSPGNNSATDSDTLSPQADLAITKTDGVTIAVAGGSLTYTITASNAGPSNASGATVADTFPVGLTVTSWTCAGAGGGTCTASGSGDITDTVNLPVGGSVTYTANATVSLSITGTVSNTATVTAPGSVTDPTPGNNSATDSDTAVSPVDVTINQKTSAPAQADPTGVSPINFTVVFASSVTGFGNSDVSLSGTAGATTAVVTGGPTTYNVAVSGMTGDGTVIATIAAGVATGSQGEPNAASTSTDNTVNYDGTLPTVSMSSVATNPTNSSPIPVTVQFSETVTGFTSADIVPGNGTVNNFAVVDGDTYTFDLTPTSQGTITANIAANKAFDTANNGNTAATQFSRVYDTVAPTATMTSTATNPTNISPITVTVQFSETVTDFDATLDVTPGNATLSNFITVDGDTYTFDLTPLSEGTVTAAIAPGSYSDVGNLNYNTTTTNFSIVYDITSPSVTIDQSDSQADPTSSSPIHFTAVFSEPVSGFTSADINYTGSTVTGTLSATITPIGLNGRPVDGTGYDVAVTGMTSSGNVLANVNAKGASDLAGNTSTISTSTDNTVAYIYAAPPVITEGTSINVTMSEDGNPTPFSLTLNATDGNGDTLTWSILTQAGFGTATASGTGNSKAIGYTPLPNYNGTDSFVVQVSDGTLTDNITVNVTIQPVADVPNLIWNQSYGIKYDTWFGVSNTSAFGGGYRRATSGDFTFHPSGKFTSFRWITYRGPDQGKAQVIVDGVVKATVDLYRATAQWQYAVEISGLSNASHAIVIKALNTKNPSSSNKWVAVDGFMTGSAALTPTARTVYDDQKIYISNTFSYGSWIGMGQTGPRFGAYRISSVANATMSFSFDGVKMTWVTARGPSYGKAAIYVDGVLKKTVDLYKSSQQWQYGIVVDNLTYGPHNVVIKVLGTKNPASSGTGIVCDGFLIE